MPFIYSADALASLDQTISTERLASYIAMAGGDRSSAIMLYERNTIISEGLYGILQALEVSLRNSIHRVMTSDLGRANWYDAVGLQATEQYAITDAKASITRMGKPLTEGRVVSELTFGFWVRLTSAKYEKLIWVRHIHKCFVGLRKPDREQVFRRINSIRELRNRVAHHEKVIHRDGQRDYKELIETLNWVCPVTAAWVNCHNSLQKNIRLG